MKKRSRTQNISAALYRTAIENMRDGIIISSNNKVIYISERLSEIAGYSQEEILSHGMDFIVQEDRSRVISLADSLKTFDKKHFDIELCIKHKDGSIHNLQCSVLRVDVKKNILLHVISDITESKRIAGRIERAVHQWRATLDAIRDMVWICDPECNLIRVNRSFAVAAGQELKDCIGKKCEMLLQEFWDICRYCPHHQVISTKRPGTAVVFSSGKYIEISASPIFDGEDVIASVCVAHDITERHQMEDALILAAQKWRTTFDGIGEAICLTDAGSIILQCNQAFTHFTGKQFNNIVNHHCREVLSTDDMDIECPVEIVKQSRQREVRTLQIGDRWFNMVADPVLNESGDFAGATLIFSDITESKKANEKLQHLYKLETDLRQALETEMKQRIEFTRALVHELKTPLTPIVASSELLSEELKEEPLLSLAKNVYSGAVNLNRRIDELLDLARGEIGMLKLNLHLIDTSKLFREVFNYMLPMATGNRQTLIPEFATLPMIMGDEDRLREVLLNLLDNACKYTQQEGTITLRASVEDNRLEAEVIDTGQGIDEGDLNRLFQPYQRLEKDREHFNGLGIGLALSKRLVELHGGNMWVRSTLGSGSTFGFSIPLTTAPLSTCAEGM